ncbi:MAG: DUF4386 family protein [Chloroflexi bacterium]|nr:DUF4386 family protein [Chloroflexota bacterium]MBU1749757.1 DUF4386 family protein [Chloroflexota bacterium]MBU1879983.1 DUF4386 family protein [Chloroflexota bacterium]
MSQSAQNSGWRGLYIAGGAAILIAVVVFRRHFGVEVALLMDMGIVGAKPPVSALDWFTLLQDNVVLGLILLDLFDIVNYVLVGLMFLALYGALRRANKSAMIVATTCDLVGVAVYLASNQAFAMLALSNQYAAATTEAQRAMFLAAGEALLAIHNPGGIHLGLLLVALAGLIASLVMLQSSRRSGVFGKVTATTGIVANSLVLGYFIVMALAPAIAPLFPSISAPFRLIWYILIAWRLFQLARGVPEEQP